jgi:excisionase family DNA binding protein
MLDGKFYTTKEAAEHTGLSEYKIRELVRNDAVAYVKIGATPLILECDLNDLSYAMSQTLTQREIARKYGISRQAVHKAFAKAGPTSAYKDPLRRSAHVYYTVDVSRFASAKGWLSHG